MHPADGKGSPQGPEHAVPHAVLSLAESSRPMVDRNLQHPKAVHLGNGSQEAMQAVKEFELGNDLAFVRFQGTG